MFSYLKKIYTMGILNEAYIVSTKYMIMDLLMIINTLKWFLSAIKQRLGNRDGVFGISAPIYEYFTHVISENGANNFVNELVKLLTTGRFNKYNQNILENTYNSKNHDKNVKLIQNPITTHNQYYRTKLIKKHKKQKLKRIKKLSRISLIIEDHAIMCFIFCLMGRILLKHANTK